MGKVKYYAVRAGHKMGVFTSWSECQDAVRGYSGALFKSFSRLDDAESWLRGEYVPVESVEMDYDLSGVSFFCCGKYDSDLDRWGYGFVLVSDGVVLGDFKGSGLENAHVAGRNLRGAVECVLAVLNYCRMNGIGSVRLYVDYEGLLKWYSGEWGCRSPLARYYLERIGLYGDIYKEFVVIGGKSKNVNYLRAVQAAKASLSR